MRGSYDYFHFIDLRKKVPQSNISYHKVYPLYSQKVNRTTLRTPQPQLKTFLYNKSRSKRFYRRKKDILSSPTGAHKQCKVNKSYKGSLHSSISHIPFQVCMGFKPLGPIDIALHDAYSSTESSHTQTKVVMQPNFLNGSNRSNNMFMTSLSRLMPTISMTTSSARQVAHQGSNSSKASQSPMRI
jgi:hypothetical protein